MRTTTPRLVFAAVAVAALAASAFGARFTFVLIAVVALLFLGTSFGEAGRLAGELQSFRGRAVEVRIWGAPLPGTEGVTMTLTSVRALGVGLHVYFQLDDARPSMHLKVAQPSRWRLADRSLEIENARYIQWSSKRLARDAARPALTMVAK